MASFANMVLNDGTLPTAVQRTFVAIQNSGIETIYIYEPSGSSKVNGRIIKVKLKRPNDPGGRYKVDINVIVPLVDAAVPAATGYTPPAKIVDTSESRMLFWLSNRAPQADRDDLLAFSRNLLSNAQVDDLIRKAQAITG